MNKGRNKYMLKTARIDSSWSLALRLGIVSAVVFGLCFVSVIRTDAQAIEEGFENVAGLPAQGWFSVNRSQPLGASVWSQCAGVAIPPAQAGPALSCALVNFQSTTGVGTISNWLLTPVRTLNNGDTVSFYTRTVSHQFPDRLQLRLSLSGASNDVGATATSVGVFTTLLVDVNPNYGAEYPLVWTQFSVTLTGLSGPTSGRFAFRYFVENGGPDGTNSNIIGLDTFAYTPAPVIVPGNAPVDFNGDGKTDFSVIRILPSFTEGAPQQLRWLTTLNGGSGVTPTDFGLTGDIPVPSDYDGDGKDDVAVWRPGAQGTFYILQSETNTVRISSFGITGDNPRVVGDYDGDGKADIAVYRPGAQSFWYFVGSQNNPGGAVTYVPWGTEGDRPAPGDYDGDGKYDFVVFRNQGGQGNYWMNRTTDGITMIPFGLGADTLVPGDYDGDGKTDLAVVRNIGGVWNWFVRSSQTTAITQLGFGDPATDLPAQGDYDGDGKIDIAIYRNSGSFWWVNSSNFFLNVAPFGQAGDWAVAFYNTH
jgi:hypothetical protein